MRQIWVTKHGPPEVLEIREAPDPVPQANEVLIEVQSAGINYADIMGRVGLYPDAPKPPCVVGYEVAGEISRVGAQVTDFQPGDRVFTATHFGGYSTKIVADARQVFSVPDGWSMNEVAGLPVNYMTAYQMLVVMGSIREGCRVLIHSAGGGVGMAATQIAALFNAEIFGAASAHKHEYLEANGVHHCIDYRKEDYLEVVMELTGGKGVDIVIDPLGGTYWKKSYRALRPTGRLLMFGISSMMPGKRKSLVHALSALVRIPFVQFNPLNLLNQNKGVLGVNVGHLWEEQEMLTSWLRQILIWADAGSVRPHIDTTFSFNQASEAHHYIQDRKNLGKVCLQP